MGDRANIYVKQREGQGVFLYTHWGGYRYAEAARRALTKRWRWTDPAYLTRIIFDELTKGCQGEETGFGISVGIEDNEHPILIVDPLTQTVSLGTATVPPVPESRSWTFEEFLTVVPDEETGDI